MKPASFLLLLLLTCALVAARAQEVSVDFSQPIGPMKAINGTNLWPPMANWNFYDREQLHQLMADLNFPMVRLHDAPWINHGIRVVDVHQIFGNLKSDPSDPENYFFAATDDYIREILEAGSKVIYRLGTSIEHTQTHYFTGPVDDPEKYAEICAGIIRHYNCGWGNGFHWDIQYWEIWNEPDVVPLMWKTDDFQTYIDFYVTVARRLREEFPDIKIGGPALAWLDNEKIRPFLETCRKENVPLDFFSWHCYGDDLDRILGMPKTVRELLDEYGFTETELHLNEWHYTNWKSDSEKKVPGTDSAAYTAAVLIGWQDTPLTMGNFYATWIGAYGLLDMNHDYEFLNRELYIDPPYYSFVAFAELLRETPNRVLSSGNQHLSILAGTGEDSVCKLLVSNYKEDQETLTIQLKGVPAYGTASIRRIDYEHKYTEESIDYSDGVLTIQNDPGSYVLFITLKQS